MPAYSSCLVRVAGPAAVVERFHLQVRSQQTVGIDEKLEEKVLCRNAAGNPVAREYLLTTWREASFLSLLARSQETEKLKLLIEAVDYFKDGDSFQTVCHGNYSFYWHRVAADQVVKVTSRIAFREHAWEVFGLEFEVPPLAGDAIEMPAEAVAAFRRVVLQRRGQATPANPQSIPSGCACAA